MTSGVEIVLDKTRRVRFTLAELRMLEQRLGKPVGEIAGDLARISVTTIQNVLWAGLRSSDTKLKYEDVERLITDYVERGDGTLSDILYVLTEALTQSGYFGRVAGESEADPRP